MSEGLNRLIEEAEQEVDDLKTEYNRAIERLSVLKSLRVLQPVFEPQPRESEGLLFCGRRTYHEKHDHQASDRRWYTCEGICQHGRSLGDQCDECYSIPPGVRR